MKGRIAVIAVLAVVLTCVFAASGVQAAESIKAYMGFSREVNEALAKRIEEKLGIQVENITLSFGEIWARLIAEAPRFNADMILSVGVAQAVDGKKKGYYECYKSPAWDDIAAAFKDPDGCYYALGTFSFVLIGNKTKLAEKGYTMPTSWKDLLDPKWKGQIVAPSPRTSGTAFMINYTFLQLYGEKEGWKYLEELDKNMAQYTKSGNAPTDLVGRGEYLLGITSDENVLKRIKDGYPIEWAIPKEGIGYEGNYCMILKGTQKLEQSKKIMDFLGSKEVSEFLAANGYIPPRPGIPSALYGAVAPTFVKLNPEWAVDNRKDILNTWKDKFIMKESTEAKEAAEKKEKEAAEAAKKQ